MTRDGDPAGNKERLRLPSAQAYLFQTQGTADETDDMLVQLGTPTAAVTVSRFVVFIRVTGCA
ncbi:MAG: hypothetical protein R3C44_13855 [Chloroflexota bacterium]